MVVKFIKKAIKRPGALHEKLHVPQGEKIPEKKISKAMHSSSPLLRKEANFAQTMKKINKSKKV